MIINNLSALKINKLTKEQYDRLLEDGLVKEDELYLIPDPVNAIPAPEVAKVGQTIVVSEIDENGTPIKWEPSSISNKWRYLGRFTTEEDVQSFIVSKDRDGNALSLQQLRIQGIVTPSNTWDPGSTSIIRVSINSAHISEGYLGSALAPTDGVTGSGFCIELSLRDGTVQIDSSMFGLNNTSVPQVMASSTSKPSGSLTSASAHQNVRSIFDIGFGGYSAGVIGAGTWFEAWGVDA